MSRRNEEIADEIVHQIMLSMVAMWHAAQPLIVAFIMTHQAQLAKGDLSVFTAENVAGLVFGILLTTWKTKQQRAAEPIARADGTTN